MVRLKCYVITSSCIFLSRDLVCNSPQSLTCDGRNMENNSYYYHYNNSCQLLPGNCHFSTDINTSYLFDNISCCIAVCENGTGKVCVCVCLCVCVCVCMQVCVRACRYLWWHKQNTTHHRIIVVVAVKICQFGHVWIIVYLSGINIEVIARGRDEHYWYI